MNPETLAKYFDHTNLKLDATEADIRKLCEEAQEMGAYSVMLYPTSVALAKDCLAGSEVKVGTVAGFPSGRFSTAAKKAEIEAAASAGAAEVDVVACYPALVSGDSSYVENELSLLAKVAHDNGVLLKVIVETCYLSDDQSLEALKICEATEADFIKTSTGFGSGGAKVETLKMWNASRQGSILLKASGGIRTLSGATALIDAGADRLGLSAGVAIIKELTTGEESAPGGGY